VIHLFACFVGLFCWTVLLTVLLNYFAFLTFFLYFARRYIILVFQFLDFDKTGSLHNNELREAFDGALNMTLTTAEFENIVNLMNRNVDGSVSLVEFKKYFRHVKPKTRKEEILAKRVGTPLPPPLAPPPRPSLFASSNTGTHGQTKIVPIRSGKTKKTIDDVRVPRKLFDEFDKDNDNALNRNEVRDVLESIGCSMKEESFELMFSECDKSSDGTITYDEFKKTM